MLKKLNGSIESCLFAPGGMFFPDSLKMQVGLYFNDPYGANMTVLPSTGDSPKLSHIEDRRNLFVFLFSDHYSAL